MDVHVHADTGVEVSVGAAQVLVKNSPTGFGYDYTFDCTGSAGAMRACTCGRIKTGDEHGDACGDGHGN